MPKPTPPPSNNGQQSGHSSTLIDAQWEVAMRSAPLPDTPANLVLMAQATRQALERNADTTVVPVNEDMDAAWQRVLQLARTRGLLAAQPTWRERVLSMLRKPQVLAPALALGLMASVALTLWQIQRPDGLAVTGLRGAAITIVTPDAEASDPRVVAELQALGLKPGIKRLPAGMLVEVAWPANATQAQIEWLNQYRLDAPARGTLRLLLVKPGA